MTSDRSQRCLPGFVEEYDGRNEDGPNENLASQKDYERSHNIEL